MSILNGKIDYIHSHDDFMKFPCSKLEDFIYKISPRLFSWYYDNEYIAFWYRFINYKIYKSWWKVFLMILKGEGKSLRIIDGRIYEIKKHG